MWDKLRAKFMGKQETRVLVVGLDGAGKSTIVQRLKYGQTMDDSEVIPTIGFNIECVEYKKMIFSLWDLGGAKETRSFWRFYYEGSQAIIFVFDSTSDAQRVEEAREDLHRLLTEHELWDAPLLIMANKQDASGAMASREITEKLQLYSLANRNWYIVDTKAQHPDVKEANLHAGLDWLYETLSTPAAQRQERARLEHRERQKAHGKADKKAAG
eukprot:Transcript_31833.p1 GENE.Transcript_31833~~Transcript_31833.p1  ORF type:complete len:214 (-),score=97.05 Transcript_31833:48-689(-)